MNEKRIIELLKQKEGIQLEFKEARESIPDSFFETVCAFLNREGGEILLGVEDSGNIIGINPDKLVTIKTKIINLSSNSQNLDPPFTLFPLEYEIQKKRIIYIQVPESSQVHKSGDIIFDRNNDSDIKVTNHEKIAELYFRKRIQYSENMIYPALRMTDFRKELFIKARSLIRSKNPKHSWLTHDDKQMLIKAGFYRLDYQTREKGYTLGAVLLFGKDEVIQQIIPHYKIDALVRKVNVDSYDYRIDIRTNLIDAYDILMEFVVRHLPDKFYQEGDINFNLRTKIFREVISNLLVHREYTNAYPATFVIYKDRVEIKNANNPHIKGKLNPDSFSPFPKNPFISKFLLLLNRVDETGSGVLNVSKYIKVYSPNKTALFIEDDIFTTVIPLNEIAAQAPEKHNDKFSEEEIEEAIEGLIEEEIGGLSGGLKSSLINVTISIYKKPGLKAEEIIQAVEGKKRTIERYIRILRTLDIIEYKGASKGGGYYLTEQFKKRINA